MNKDTAIMRGVRTAIQAAIGALVGLVGVIWAVPGVPEAVTAYLQNNIVPILIGIGIPAGLAGFIWNWLRKDVKTV